MFINFLVILSKKLFSRAYELRSVSVWKKKLSNTINMNSSSKWRRSRGDGKLCETQYIGHSSRPKFPRHIISRPACLCTGNNSLCITQGNSFDIVLFKTDKFSRPVACVAALFGMFIELLQIIHWSPSNFGSAIIKSSISTRAYRFATRFFRETRVARSRIFIQKYTHFVPLQYITRYCWIID